MHLAMTHIAPAPTLIPAPFHPAHSFPHAAPTTLSPRTLIPVPCRAVLPPLQTTYTNTYRRSKGPCRQFEDWDQQYCTHNMGSIMVGGLMGAEVGGLMGAEVGVKVGRLLGGCKGRWGDGCLSRGV